MMGGGLGDRNWGDQERGGWGRDGHIVLDERIL